MHFTSVVALVAFVASVSALSTGHHARAPHHRSIAARVAAPIAATEDSIPSVRRRANGKRCKPRPSSTALAVSSSTPKDEPTSPPKPAPTTTPKAEPATTVKEEPATTPKPAPTTHKADPTTTQKQDPATTPKPAPTTTKQAPAPTTTKASSGGGSGLSFMSGTQTGQGTFYSTGLGACGITNNDGQKIAAVSHLLFDSYPGYNGANPNANPMCGRQVRASYQGKSVVVSLTDRCEGCALTDLDFSPSAFQELADFSVGRISGMTWTWV